jgi:alpha-tubulin suppressor-like RCC1 family protein
MVYREDGTPGGSPLSEVESIALGAEFGCAATRQGTFCWGKNESGQLARPLSVTASPSALLAQPGPQRLVGAGIAVLTLDGAGQLCAWGRNATKMISDADAIDVHTMPVCRMVTPSAALVVGDTHACLRFASGSFSCWGERYYGQLGIGGNDTADVAPPNPMAAPTSLEAPVTALVAGVSHTCALLSSGAVTCFGRNHLGQVGAGARTAEEEVREPAPVTGFGATVVALGSGSTAQHTCAILQDGSVQCWGSNASGQLGDATASRPLTIDATRVSRVPLPVAF